MNLVIGVDTGGTFTDVVACDPATGAQTRLKVSSTRDDPSEAIAFGVQQAIERLGGSGVARLVHGTTVATNALLERRGAATALVTTAGMRDLLAIGRQNRPALYDLRARRTAPLVPRQWCFEVAERINHDGTVRQPLDADALPRLATALRQVGAEAVVVGLLFSHINPAHEVAIAEYLARELPEVAVTLSHTMAAVPGEFERLSTAAVNAFVQPVMRKYLSQLATRLADVGLAGEVLVMKSSGGVAPASAVADRCVETVLSGPAGGVMACVDLARVTGVQNLIAADMGGTSFDVAVVTHGQAGHARDTQVAGHPLRTAMLDLHTIGAGGGSIAWVDTGGALRVGPQSAGAVPGPTCYGRGGDLPTVTDANLVLGRLVADSRLAGGMQLDLAAARAAIDAHLAQPLGLTIEQAAMGVLRVVNTAMTAAIRQITVQRGIDPRDYALCAYGGAGPLHVAELAAELQIGQVVVPRAPGVFSAEGLLGCDLREDRMRAHIEPLSTANFAQLHKLFGELETEAAAAFDAGDYQARWSLGMRYTGQSTEIPIAFGDDAADLAQRFADAHEQLYGFARRDHAVEIASLWVAVTVPTAGYPAPQLATAAGPPGATGERIVYFAGEPFDTQVFRREDLLAGSIVDGPAIVEQDDTTIVVPLGWQASTDAWGNLMMTANKGTPLRNHK